MRRKVDAAANRQQPSRDIDRTALGNRIGRADPSGLAILTDATAAVLLLRLLWAGTNQTHPRCGQGMNPTFVHRGHQPSSVCPGLPQPADSAPMPQLGITQAEADLVLRCPNIVIPSKRTIPRTGMIATRMSARQASELGTAPLGGIPARPGAGAASGNVRPPGDLAQAFICACLSSASAGPVPAAILDQCQ